MEDKTPMETTPATDHGDVTGQRPKPIVFVEQELIVRDRFASVRRDKVRFETSGAVGTHWKITSGEGFPGVVILPFRDGHVGLAESYRYTIDRWLWELPRGRAQSANSRAEAARELHEETRADQIELFELGEAYNDTGLLDNLVRFFLAKLAPGCPYRVGAEIADVRWVPLADFKAMILRGEIKDPFAMTALALAQLHGLLD
jgi:8-oxo-dGTP pyrophosphatase MutT (NUDIX family)